MKNSKSVKKSEKTTKAKVSGKSKTVVLINSVRGENEVREKANEIYRQRTEQGLQGTAESDWNEAEKLLKETNFQSK